MPVCKSIRNLGSLAFAAILVFLSATPAYADAFVCTAKIAGVGITPGGTVVLNLTGMGWPYMCNLNSPMATSQGAISTATCQAWLSEFLTAKASGQSYSFWFDYGAATPPACNAMPSFSWQVPAVFPYYMSFETFGG